MRRGLLLAVFALVVLFPKLGKAQLNAYEKNVARAEATEGHSLLIWKWINFWIMMAGLGYLAAKKGPAFFNARSRDIQKAIEDATGLKVQAEFRSSEIDRRMAALSSEIAQLKDSARADMEKEAARIEEETAAALSRIHEQATREIQSMHHQAERAVREHAVNIAFDLALVHLRENPEQANQDELVSAFTSDLRKRA
jgi:F0F1-type ATP synthase membrane subunit b/b'